jgi:hypothetical protein
MGGENTASTQPAASNAASVPAASAEPTVKPTVKAEPKAGVGDRARDGKFEFVVTKVQAGKKSVGGQYLQKKAQGQFVLVSITVENIGDQPQSLLGDNQYLYDRSGRKFSADTEAAFYLDDSNSFFEEINPGNTVKGMLIFDLPENVKPERLELHDSMFSLGVEVTL